MNFSYRHPITKEFKTVAIPGFSVDPSKTIKIRLEVSNESKPTIYYVDPKTSERKRVDTPES